MQFNLLCGDAIEKLRILPDNSINTCVTSPSYYGLQDYDAGTWVGGDLSCLHYRRSKLIKEHTGTGHARGDFFREQQAMLIQGTDLLHQLNTTDNEMEALSLALRYIELICSEESGLEKRVMKNIQEENREK